MTNHLSQNGRSPFQVQESFIETAIRAALSNTLTPCLAGTFLACHRCGARQWEIAWH